MVKKTTIRIDFKTWNRLIDMKLKSRTNVKMDSFDCIINKMIDVYEGRTMKKYICKKCKDSFTCRERELASYCPECDPDLRLELDDEM